VVSISSLMVSMCMLVLGEISVRVGLLSIRDVYIRMIGWWLCLSRVICVSFSCF